MLGQEFIKTLHIGEFERFLGIPIGSKFLFNVTTDIPAQLNKLSDSMAKNISFKKSLNPLSIP